MIWFFSDYDRTWGATEHSFCIGAMENSVHGGLGWATIHDKVPLQAAAAFASAKPTRSRFSSETFAVAQSIRPGRGGTLGQDDDEAGD